MAETILWGTGGRSSTGYASSNEEKVYNPRNLYNQYPTVGGGMTGPFDTSYDLNQGGMGAGAVGPGDPYGQESVFVPSSGSGSSGGGGGGRAPKPIQWVLDEYDPEQWSNAPEWFRPFTVENSEHFSDPRVSFTLMANSLIGSGGLSPEDSRNLGLQLYNMWGGQKADNPWDLYSNKFEGLDGETFTPAESLFKSGVDPYEVTRMGAPNIPITAEQAAMGQTGPSVLSTQERYAGDRGRSIIDALSNMREATVGGNVHEFGPGYQYLQSLSGEVEKHAGADNFLTRAERLSLRGALDPLMAQSAEGELGPYNELARMISEPYYTFAPPAMTRLPTGEYQEGERNPFLSF
jgi:hypothetical protein